MTVRYCMVHWQGSIDFNTVRTTRLTGMYFLIYPLGWINDKRMAVQYTAMSRDISRASGNLVVVGDDQPDTSLLSVVCGYNFMLLTGAVQIMSV